MEQFPYLNGGRYPYPIADSEMQRRQEAVLAEMEKRGIDCLVLQSNIGWLGGAMKYLTDLSVLSYSNYALFSKQGIVLFGHGGRDGGVAAPFLKLRGVVEQHSQPWIISMSNTEDWHPANMVKCIRERGFKTIGFVGMSYISANIYKYLTENLTECEFVYASDITDRLRSVKSEYELELYENCTKVHDRLAACAPAILRPGKTERQVVTELNYIANSMDCAAVNVMIGSAPIRPPMTPYTYTNKVIGKDDVVAILFELCTPYFTWGEVGRLYMFKKPTKAQQEASDYCLYLQDYMAELCVPGAMPAEIFAKLNEKLRAKGYGEEGRLGLHSQSCDIVERPAFLPEETMPLEENMFLANHPSCGNSEAYGWSCDNYVVKKGGAVRMNKTPRGIVVLD